MSSALAKYEDGSEEVDEMKSLFTFYRLRIIGLCAFIWFLSFKPSEPYLSEYLICNKCTEQDYCASFSTVNQCNSNSPCEWINNDYCSIISCSSLTTSQCNSNTYDYCYVSNDGSCDNSYCYKNFSENEVNNDIYPWSTYAYFPFLLFLGPIAELYSYRIAILFGISGRVITRFLLLFGTSLTSMQIMQVTYAMGTAAEDVFSAYIYYAVSPPLYTKTTAYVRSSFFVSCVLSGILGDILVTQGNCSISILMIISAVCVSIGFIEGFFVIENSNPSDNYLKHSKISKNSKISNVSVTWNILKEQLSYLPVACKDFDSLLLILYWLFGNAVFMILYSYEVSIYDELNGNNNWNGSVLSLMLFGSSIGAFLPSLLDVNESSSMNQKLYLYLIVTEVIACISVILSIYFWSILATISYLTIFFTSWQFINVVTLSQLAHSLKRAQILSVSNKIKVSIFNVVDNPVNDDLNTSKHPLNGYDLSNIQLSEESLLPSDPEPPYSIAVVTISALCVLLQIILQSILFSGLQLELKVALHIITIIFAISTICHLVFSIYRIIYSFPSTSEFPKSSPLQ